jgi:tetratricopeptide (TPR) repeat protein
MSNRKPFAFVSLPADERAKNLYDRAIVPAVVASGLEATSFYEAVNPDEFDRRMRRLILLANLMVADVSGINPNVVYEVGVAVGYGKPVVLVVDQLNLDRLPSMIRARTAVVLRSAPADATDSYYEECRARIAAFMDGALRGNYIERRFQQHTQVLLAQPCAGGSRANGASLPSEDLRSHGIAAYHNGDYHSSIACLSKALKDGDRNHDTYFYLADSFFLCGEGQPPGESRTRQFLQMQAVACEGHGMHPSNTAIAKSYGLACLKVGNLQQAEEIFQALVRQQPDFVVARYNLACVYAQQRSKSRLMQALREVFDANREFRYLARLDCDFDPYWNDESFQRLLYPCDP